MDRCISSSSFSADEPTTLRSNNISSYEALDLDNYEEPTFVPEVENTDKDCCITTLSSDDSDDGDNTIKTNFSDQLFLAATAAVVVTTMIMTCQLYLYKIECK